MKKLFVFLIACSLNAEVYINQSGVLIKRPIKSWIEFRNANLTRQQYDYSCGSASLATILKYYYQKSDITERSIIDDILKSKGYELNQNEVLKEGDNIISFSDLAQYAKSQGFRAIGLGVDFESLAKLKMPVIVFLTIRSIDHFSVYKGMDKEYVYLADPSFGNIQIKLDQFKKMFFQRDDPKYPGKILAILSQDMDTNKDFMSKPTSSHLNRELIEQDLIHHRFR